MAVPVLVKLPELALMYWNDTTLRNIVVYLGHLHKVDNAILTKSRMMYARVLMETNVHKGFSNELFYSNENEEFVTICPI